jgi:small subunit ribosomal protein S2
MSKIKVKDLLDAGVHFGHLTRKWNPNMAPFIHMERNGIHIINLYKTVTKIEEAQQALQKIASSGRKILFVATKKQAKDIVSEKASKVNMPYITERWPGGMLTNFVTIRKAVKKMSSVDRMKADGTFNTLSKKERLQVERMRAKLEKNLGSISDMTRLPGALFIVDIRREHIAVREAQKLNIPIFAMVDTNADPRDVDFAIPANDDASKSIDKILGLVTEAVAAGTSERKKERDEANAASSEGEVVPETTEVAEEVIEAATKAVKEKTPAIDEGAAPFVEENETAEIEASPAEEVAETAAEDLSRKTVSDLRALAKEARISGYSKMKKAELIAALSA